MHTELQDGGGQGGTPRILLDLADGGLTSIETETVVDWLTASGLETVPPWVVNRAVRISKQAVASVVPQPTPWRRVIAALLYDNRLQPGVAGARSVDLDRPRLRYMAGEVEIDLEINESSLVGRVRVLGQVLTAVPTLARAWVSVDGASGHLKAPIDELGQFSLDGLATGTYCMHLTLPDEVIEIPELVL